MTKDLFIRSLNKLQDYTEWEQKLYELGIDFWEREEVNNLLTSYIELLEENCKDTPVDEYESGTISRYIYDAEFGNKADEYPIIKPDGTKVKLRNAEALWDYLVKIHPEIDSDDTGNISDGYHTFNDLYKQRMILSASLCNSNKDKCWKSKYHEDGSKPFGGGWFVLGFDTPKGSYTYHYELAFWSLFKCKELPVAKHWDGHTSDDVGRLLFL